MACSCFALQSFNIYKFFDFPVVTRGSVGYRFKAYMMNILKTLKHNKIKKIVFAKRCGLTTRQGLYYQIDNHPDKVKGALMLYLLEKSGVRVEELIKDKIIND